MGRKTENIGIVIGECSIGEEKIIEMAKKSLLHKLVKKIGSISLVSFLTHGEMGRMAIIFGGSLEKGKAFLVWNDFKNKSQCRIDLALISSRFGRKHLRDIFLVTATDADRIFLKIPKAVMTLGKNDKKTEEFIRDVSDRIGSDVSYFIGKLESTCEENNIKELFVEKSMVDWFSIFWNPTIMRRNMKIHPLGR